MKILFFLVGDELIASAFFAFSCCARRIRQKATPNFVLWVVLVSSN